MAKIAKLDQKTTNLIAAGEVVERVVSVVKELVENSIDAKASIIDISLLDSGLSMISVSDNGVGMERDDLELCVLPHYTSKIKNENDLFSIHTLGFRGEALPSIAQVSEMKIKTCATPGEGYEATFFDGNLVGIDRIAYPIGTSVIVEKLFYNTPARLQNMNSEASELSYVTDFVSKISLAYPEISFSLSNNAKEIFRTNGNAQTLEVISSIYGPAVAKEMLPFTKETNFFAIEGYTSSLSVLRSSKAHITILVNGRSIRNYQISNAIIAAYSNRLMNYKYPICVINISCDYSLVDVNVHPSKTEVRFAMERELCDLVKNTIASVLDDADLTVYASLPEAGFSAPKVNENPFDIFNDEVKTSVPVERVVEKESILEEAELPIVEEKGAQIKVDYQTLDVEEEKKTFNFTYIGQLFSTYLLFQDKETFYLIDQHAAEERVNYERIKQSISSKEVVKVELMVPYNFTFSPAEYLLLKERLSILDSLGIEAEEFGANTLLIRSVGSWIPKRYINEYLEEVFNSVIRGYRQEKSLFLDTLAKSIACKSSIEANELLSEDDVASLVDLLNNCKNPYTCPHGRPVVIKYDKSELEKWFKRIV